jgi:hypothetical protein
MKKLVGIILVVAFVIFAIADIIHDFIASDGIHYFSAQPHRLLLVAVIGIAGGLVAFGFSALSPRLQRGVKLVVLGSGASFVMLAGGYLSFQVASLPKLVDPTLSRHIPWILLLCTIAVAGLLCFEFYRVLRSRDRVA